VTPADFEYLRRLLQARSGLVLPADKQYLVESRLLPLARRAGLCSVGGLVQQLRSGNSDQVTTEVVEAMTTNESFFFRDKIPFEQLRTTTIPKLMTARAGRRRIRIWCAAAATGQEPYSVAMSLREMGARVDGWRVDIVASDLSNEVLRRAKAGLYSHFEVQRGLPIALLLKYFEQKGEQWQIAPELRAMVHFRQLNLLGNFSHLGMFDIVFCRNVLIYFDRDTKARVLARLARAIAPVGYLALGAAETVIGLSDAFRPVVNERGLYTPANGKSERASAPSLRIVAAAS
jgi:chemotaxis protein methyltransferase CheR